MQRNQFEKNWQLIQHELGKKWDQLTPEDIYEIDGMFDQCIHVLTKRYNWSWEKAEREVENWRPPIVKANEEHWTGEASGDESPETYQEKKMRERAE